MSYEIIRSQSNLNTPVFLTKFFVNFHMNRVYMRCVTWSRDSHGLFDYESRFISKKNIKTVTEGRIVRNNNDVELIGIN